MENIYKIILNLFLGTILIVFFVHGCTCSKQETVDPPPIADNNIVPMFTIYPESGNTSMLFEFDASNSEYIGNEDSLLLYKWDFEGDNIYDTELSENTYASHIFSFAGNYNVTLYAKDKNGDAFNTATKNLTVSPSGGSWPTVTTDTVTNILATAAGCGGEVIDIGSSAVISRGICWSTSSNPTIYDSHTVDGSGPGAFTSSMTGLDINTVYYVKAYATNDAGTGYGNTRMFTTVYTSGPCPGVPAVSWQGETYNTTLIGDQCWMDRNLNWEIGNSVCYQNLPANCVKYGRLYDWETMMSGALSSGLVPSGVQGICPEGWHIPSDDEWKILEAVVDPYYGIGDTIWDETGWRSVFTGKYLKSTSGWHLSGNGEDIFGFTGKPGGSQSNGVFSWEGSEGIFWSSTESESSDYAYFRSLNYYFSGSYRDVEPKIYYFSVRCLKD
jgi:uncharacterized protein (TIGR02145 family)